MSSCCESDLNFGDGARQVNVLATPVQELRSKATNKCKGFVSARAAAEKVELEKLRSARDLGSVADYQRRHSLSPWVPGGNRMHPQICGIYMHHSD